MKELKKKLISQILYQIILMIILKLLNSYNASFPYQLIWIIIKKGKKKDKTICNDYTKHSELLFEHNNIVYYGYRSIVYKRIYFLNFDKMIVLKEFFHR